MKPLDDAIRATVSDLLGQWGVTCDASTGDVIPHGDIEGATVREWLCVLGGVRVPLEFHPEVRELDTADVVFELLRGWDMLLVPYLEWIEDAPDINPARAPRLYCRLVARGCALRTILSDEQIAELLEVTQHYRA